MMAPGIRYQLSAGRGYPPTPHHPPLKSIRIFWLAGSGCKEFGIKDL